MYIKTQELLNKNTLTYQEILNIKKRLNGYSKSREDNTELEWKDEYFVTPEHTQKGLEYLNRVCFKPSLYEEMLEKTNKEDKANGVVDDKYLRISCPLGCRELAALLTFDHFTFAGLYDASTYYQAQSNLHNYLPIWRCYGADGDSFDYYLEGGNLVVIG